MYLKLISLLFLTFSLKAFSETFTARLQDVFTLPNSELLLSFSDGRIAWGQNDSSTDKNFIPGIWYKVKIDNEVKIQHIETLEIQKKEMELNPSFAPDENFISDKLTWEQSGKILAEMTNLNSQSPSSDRAHYWAYQLFNQDNVKSMKYFLLPSLDQMKKNNLKFWFYVGLSLQDHDGFSMILDPVLSNQPMSVSYWLTKIIGTDSECQKKTTKDFVYSSLQCQMLEINMYYRRPVDVIRLQIQEFIRSHFYESEIEESRFSVLEG